MEPDVIDLFMWGYQRHFQILLNEKAKKLFDLIDPKLAPNIFFIGILVDENHNSHPVCLEPEDCGYDLKIFSNVKELAKELEKVDEERNIFNSHPIAQEQHVKAINIRSFIKALNSILDGADYNKKTEKFISSPTYIGGYNVFIVLEIQKKVFDKHCMLTKKKWNIFRITRSYVESIIFAFLKESTSSLIMSSNPLNISDRPYEELLRSAAKDFMFTIAQVGDNTSRLYSLYETCNEIASLKYEGAEGIGKMIIANKNHSNIRYSLQLNEPIELKDFRKVRKFLEISTNDLYIISDSAFIYGIGEFRDKYNPKDESMFVINFISHYNWEVLHNDISLMVVKYNMPNIPKSIINKDKFYSDMKRNFSNIGLTQINDIWDIVIEATNQKHGTMLVISDKAKDEAERLGGQCFPIKPIKLTKNLIQQITSIDGAVLLDIDANCHAIGVILDGLATKNGDSARGARYNSAIRYYEYICKNIQTLIIVISEDGMINIIPSLLPQIKHDLINTEIEKLKQLKVHRQKDIKLFNKIMDLLERHEFYLTFSECETINSLRKEIETEYRKSENLWINRNDLHPNNDMNESYYL